MDRCPPGESTSRTDAAFAVSRGYEPPRLTRVGTLRDLLAGCTGTSDDAVSETFATRLDCAEEMPVE
jgi:hypothetical protein